LVTAEGIHKTINSYVDPEYFFAVSGGGGSSWGVSGSNESSKLEGKDSK
jgi:hypothetical protein